MSVNTFWNFTVRYLKIRRMKTPTKSRRSAAAVAETENRRLQLQRWICDYFGGSQAEFVRAHSLNQGEISGLLGTKSFGSVKARNLEEDAKMPKGYLEEIHKVDDEQDHPPQARVVETHLETMQSNPEDAGSPPFLRRIPVIGVARMGNEGYYTDVSTATGHGDGHVEVYTKDPNAYALRVRGDSMAPAIKDGWVVVIEPNGSVAPGEYVLVGLVDGRKMVKELLFQRSDAIALVSVNGDKRITLDPAEVEMIHPVIAIVPPSKWMP